MCPPQNHGYESEGLRDEVSNVVVTHEENGRSNAAKENIEIDTTRKEKKNRIS